jgi:hypothetical protein
MFSELGISTPNLRFNGFRYHQISSSFLLAVYLEEMEMCEQTDKAEVLQKQ